MSGPNDRRHSSFRDQLENLAVEYWTIYKPGREKPDALVKILHGKPRVVAGDMTMAKVFPLDTLRFPNINYQFEGHLPAWHPLLQASCGDLEDPATGIIFTLPLDRVVGLATLELGEQPE